jgi:phage gp36-like protein
MARATRKQFENRVSPSLMARILDDDNDGIADYDPVAQLLEDASSKVDSYLAPLGVLPLTAPYPNEVIRLELDIAMAYAIQRHPEAATSHNWEKLMEQAEKDLCRLRKGETMLGTAPSTPDPPANHGGAVYNNTAAAVAAAEAGEDPSAFWDDTGDW